MPYFKTSKPRTLNVSRELLRSEKHKDTSKEQ